MPGRHLFRIDGSVDTNKRKQVIDGFNDGREARVSPARIPSGGLQQRAWPHTPCCIDACAACLCWLDASAWS